MEYEKAEDRLANPRLIEIEGMAMTGYIRAVRLEECGRPEGWKKIIAESVDGQLLETGCMEPDAAKRNFMVLTLYARNWGKLVNQDSSGEDEY